MKNVESQQVLPNEHFLYKQSQSSQSSAKRSVTVIVQCYNRTTFLDDAIGSVRKQTFKDYDLIIFDNGSLPEQSEEIEAIAARYDADYIRAFRNGHGDNIRRLIIPLLSTRYVAILHDDDKWKPEKLCNSIAELENKNLDYVFSNKQYIDTSGNIIPSVDLVDAAISDCNYANLKPEQVIERGLFKASILHWSTLVIKREVLWQEFSRYSAFYRIGDWMFFSHLAMSDNLKGSFLESRDTFIRIHANNDFSYLKFSPLKRVIARTRLVNEQMHFFNEIISYPENKFTRIFQECLQGNHGNKNYNRCYLDVSFRISEWPSPAWIYFSKQCYLKALELDAADTHDYLLSHYQTCGDDYVAKLDMTYFVRNMALCFSFMPEWCINLIINAVHFWKRYSFAKDFFPPMGKKQSR